MTTGIPEMHKFHVPTLLLGSANTLYQFMSWEFFVEFLLATMTDDMDRISNVGHSL